MSAGPYQSEAEAAEAPMPREAAVAFAAGHAASVPTLKLDALLDACQAAGVVLGFHDRQTLRWLARWEPTTVQVFVGLISRAHAAGCAQPQDGHR